MGRKKWGRLLAALLMTFLSLAKVARSYSSGPPTSVCGSMLPDPGAHGPAQTSSVPYKLVPGKATVAGGATLSLTLSKIDVSAVPDFKGFLIEGVESETGKLVGSFRIPPGSPELKPMTCNNIQAGAVSHLNSVGKSSVTVDWTAPNVAQGQQMSVTFYFTVVQTYNKFWARQPAASKLLVQASSEPPPAPQPEGQVDGDPEESRPDLAMFAGCGSSMGCFGAPAECNVKKGGCDLVVGYSRLGAEQKMQLRVHKKGFKSGQYMAMALSDDAVMGDDLVFACRESPTPSPSTYLIDARWNSGKSNLGQVQGVTFEDISAKTEDGFTVCNFKVAETLRATPPGQSSPVDYDLVKKAYFILMATGQASRGGNNLEYHLSRAYSDEPVDLTSTSVVGAEEESHSLIKAHGCLMVIAWIGFAAAGKLLPRYFRETWRSVRPGGKDLWFQLHQLFMGSTVLLTLIALIIICIAEGAWPYSAEFIRAHPHPAVGVACLILAFIQPVMAFFRPHPGTKYRFVFNWAHRIVGNSSFILAVATIFLAADLKEAGLTWGYTAVLIVMIVIYFVVHLVLSGLGVVVGLKNGGPKVGHSSNMPMGHVNGHGTQAASDDPNVDAAGSVIRKIVLLVYLTFNWTCVIALLVYIGRGSDN